MREVPRTAIVLDLENLLHEYRWGALELGLHDLASVLSAYTTGSTLVAAIAYCDGDLARLTAWPLAAMGFRVHPNTSSGPDAADRDLAAYLSHALPRSIDTVVIGSGDHSFAECARRLREAGRRVEVVARPTTLSAELYLAADAVHMLPYPPVPPMSAN